MATFRLTYSGRPFSGLANLGGTSCSSSWPHLGRVSSTAQSSRRVSSAALSSAASSDSSPPVVSPVSLSPSSSSSADLSPVASASVPPLSNSSSCVLSSPAACASPCPSSSSSRSFPLGIKQTLPRHILRATGDQPSSSSSMSALAAKPPKSPCSLSVDTCKDSSPSELVVYERRDGKRWVHRHQLSLYLSHAVGLGYFRAQFEDSSVTPAAVFDCLSHLVRPPVHAARSEEDEGDEGGERRQNKQVDGAPDGDGERVTAQDLSEFMKNCVASRYRDVDVLDVVTDVLSALLIGSADLPLLVDIASSCIALSLLRPKLFTAIASRLLVLLPPAPASGSSPLDAAALSPRQAVRLVESFSQQRFRHPDVLPLLFLSLSPSLPFLSPRLACRLLHAVAGLGACAAPAETVQLLLSRVASGLGDCVGRPGCESETHCQTATGDHRMIQQPSDLPESEFLEKQIQGQKLQPQSALADLTKATHALLLLEIELEQKPLLESLLTAMAPEIFDRPVEFWSSSPAGPSLHRRLLLIRTALRHLHRDTIYNSLPTMVRQAFRRLHRIEITSPPRSPTHFVTRMSALLTRLRIAHFCYAIRGPLVFDVLERDRPIVWQCNTADRFYVNSAEKTTAVKLQERITQAMGLKVGNCEYWQWMKMKRKRTRLEYIRMQRYYILKDRRQHDPDFEGWTLPLVHHMHRRNRLHYDYYFPNYTPLSRVEY
ncbi:RAP domain-containing protein [Toxoplasma gondii MAS]|uniref:RAP domain-containing protein n=1 Tax=Toxoplasma gondii MAS TaxID=943118 RepID=A0A086QD76_TOXGO|nr:RAP domain-containing protein [Toxoplasma gondii MAS]